MVGQVKVPQVLPGSPVIRRSRPQWWRSALVVGAAAWILFAVVIGCGLLWSEHQTAAAPRTLLTSLVSEFAINVDHPHIGDGSAPCLHEALTAVMSPRSATALVALGVLVAVAAIVAWPADLAVRAARASPAALSDRDLLTRFCLARR